MSRSPRNSLGKRALSCLWLRPLLFIHSLLKPGQKELPASTWSLELGPHNGLGLHRALFKVSGNYFPGPVDGAVQNLSTEESD